MEITATSLYVGQSVHARCPVAHHTLAGIEQWSPACFDRTFLDDLLHLLPGLGAHWEACGATARETVPLAVNHLFEHVCIELQNLAGCQIECVRAESARAIAPNEAVVAFDEAEVGVEAARLAVELFRSLLPGDLRSSLPSPPSAAPLSSSPSANSANPELRDFDLARRLAELVRLAERTLLPIQDRELVKRARARGIPVTRLVGRILQLGHGRYQQRMSATKTTRTNVVSNDLAANKDYARRILAELGLPVPRSERVYRLRDAVEAARRIGYPVVVKPNNGSMGGGVSVGMRNRREVRAAWRRARELDRSVLVEEVVAGSDFRMLVIDGELCAASQRIPGHVVGDGTRTVEALLAAVNSDPRRGTGPRHSWTRIELDEQATRLLEGLGYTRRSIPAAGEVVYLRRNANTSDGGTAVDVTDLVHPDNRDVAIRAARAIGLDVVGVDLLTTDISRSIWETGGRILEINSRPGLRKHLWPAEGTPRDVLTPILDMLFPPGHPTRVPIVAVTGTGHTGTTARMIAHVLAAEGHHVGLAVGHRVYIGGRRIGHSRATAPAAARMILLDPDVDIAVLEITPDDVLRHGLGCDAIDVSVIVDGAPGQADASEPPPSEAALDALRVISRATRDSVLLGGALEGHRLLAPDPGGAQLCPVFASPEGGDRAAPIPRVGRRIVFDGQAVRVYERGDVRAELPVPSRLASPEPSDAADAELARSAVFAIAAAHSLGKAPERIHRSLSAFEPSATRPPRRGRKKASA